MRYFVALSFATLGFTLGSVASAQPANDRIQNAIVLSSETRVNRVTGNMRAATRDTDVLISDDPAATIDSLYIYPYPAVWYKWEAPISGSVRVQMNAYGFWVFGVSVEGSTTDPYYLPGIADPDSPVEPEPIPYYNEAGRSNLSTSYGSSGISVTNFNYEVEGGKTYYIGAGNFGTLGANNPSFDIALIQIFTPDAISDTFANRTLIGGTKFSITGNLGSFGAEDGEPQHSTTAVTPARRTGWMTITRKKRSSVKLTAESRVFEPLVAVYSGDELTTLTKLGQSTSGTGSERGITAATMSFIAEAGVPYAIAVDGNRSKAGGFTLNVETSTVRPGFLVKPLSTTVYQTEPATFTATAASTGEASYQWQKLNTTNNKWEAVLDDDSIFFGAETNTLSIASTTLEMNGQKFRVVVTDDVGPTASSAVILTVTEFPTILSEVLGQIKFEELAFSTIPAPTNGGTYFAIGLPKGLSIDPATGVISGTITAKPGSYRIVYGSTNGKKRNPQQFVLLIQVSPFSAALTGAYEALLNDASPQPRPAGKLKITVGTTGSYTGSYFSLSDSKTYSFRGVIALDQIARAGGTAEGAPIIISRGRNVSALQLSFVMTEPPQDVEGADTTWTATLHEVVGGAFIGDTFGGIKLKKFTAASPAPWAGIYTARLTRDQNFGSVSGDGLPAGSGYATASIGASNGTLSLRGRLAEGTAFTASLPSSINGKYYVAQRVHGVGGSLSGTIALISRQGDLLLYHSPDFGESELYWVKTPDKNYPSGVGPLSLDFRMEPWQNPGTNFTRTFGLSILDPKTAGSFTVNLASALVNNGLINGMNNIYSLPVDLKLSPAGVITVPETDFNPDGNPTGFKIVVNKTNGLLSGSFTITQPPAPPSIRATKHKVSLTGVMFQAVDIFTNDIIGEGHFLIPALSKGSPVTSGLIELRAGTPDSEFGGSVEDEETNTPAP